MPMFNLSELRVAPEQVLDLTDEPNFAEGERAGNGVNKRSERGEPGGILAAQVLERSQYAVSSFDKAALLSKK